MQENLQVAKSGMHNMAGITMTLTHLHTRYMRHQAGALSPSAWKACRSMASSKFVGSPPTHAAFRRLSLLHPAITVAWYDQTRCRVGFAHSSQLTTRRGPLALRLAFGC